MGFEKIGLKKLGDRARGLLTEGGEGEGVSDLGVGSRGKKRRKGRHSKVGSGGFGGKLHLEDLVQQADEIAQDKENLHVRTVCLLLTPFVHSDAADALVLDTCRDIRGISQDRRPGGNEAEAGIITLASSGRTARIGR